MATQFCSNMHWFPTFLINVCIPAFRCIQNESSWNTPVNFCCKQFSFCLLDKLIVFKSSLRDVTSECSLEHSVSTTSFLCLSSEAVSLDNVSSSWKCLHCIHSRMMLALFLASKCWFVCLYSSLIRIISSWFFARIENLCSSWISLVCSCTRLSCRVSTWTVSNSHFVLDSDSCIQRETCKQIQRLFYINRDLSWLRKMVTN